MVETLVQTIYSVCNSLKTDRFLIWTKFSFDGFKFVSTYDSAVKSQTEWMSLNCCQADHLMFLVIIRSFK